MNADAHVHLFIFLFLSVIGFELSLDLLGALDHVDHGREIDQEGITDSFNDRAVMFSDGVLNELVMNLQQAQHAGFVGPHLAAEAHHVGEHDGR